MTSGPPVPAGGGPKLPAWLTAKKRATDYNSMTISPPRPIRCSVDKQGNLSFTGPEGLRIAPQESINGVIMAFSRPRSFWKEAGSTKGKAPDCSSSDGVNGKGKHIVQPGDTAAVPNEDGEYVHNDTNNLMVIERECSSCPMAQYGSGQGNSQACKQTIRLGVYIPTHYPVAVDDNGNPTEWSESLNPWWSEANNESWPAQKAPPLIFNISPTGIKEFEAYVRWMQSAGIPMEAFWCEIKGSTKSVGQWTVGVPSFSGAAMDEHSEWFYDYAIELSKHPVVADIKAAGVAEDYVVE
jgi:hypothetical protein